MLCEAAAAHSLRYPCSASCSEQCFPVAFHRITDPSSRTFTIELR